MKELCFATNNRNKIAEVSQMLEGKYKLLSLEDIGCNEELAEDQDTLEGNSRQKANYVWTNYNVNCFADDTGLEVDAICGEPGVYSARYAGPQRSDADNINKLLHVLEGQESRRAREEERAFNPHRPLHRCVTPPPAALPRSRAAARGA